MKKSMPFIVSCVAVVAAVFLYLKEFKTAALITMAIAAVLATVNLALLIIKKVRK